VIAKEEKSAAPSTFIRHRGYVAWDEPVKNELDEQDSTFRIRPTATGYGVHFESVNFNKYFLKHFNFRLRIAPYSKKDLYTKDSTWIPRKVEC